MAYKKIITQKRVLYFLIVMVFITVVGGGVKSILNRCDECIVLIVTKDQSDTPSLNPTRLQVAAKMALQDFKQDLDRTVPIKNHYITYTGEEEEGYRLAKAYLDKTQNVLAIVGDFNSQGTALIADLADKYNLLHLSFFATDEAIFTDNSWSYSYRSRLVQEHEMMEKILFEHIDASKIVTVSTNVSNLLRRREELESAILPKGIHVNSSAIFEREEQDFREYIQGLKEQEYEFDTIVLFLSASQIEHFMQQLYIVGIDKPVVIAGVTMSIEGVSELQGIMLPMYTFVPAVFLQVDQTLEAQVQSFVERYRVAMGYHRFDTLGPWIYDGMQLLYEIILEECSIENMQQQLNEYGHQRMIGWVSFDKEGHLEDGTFRIVQVINGRFVEVEKR